MVSFTQLDIETERYRSELHDFLGSMQDFEPAVRPCRRRLHSTPLHASADTRRVTDVDP